VLLIFGKFKLCPQYCYNSLNFNTNWSSNTCEFNNVILDYINLFKPTSHTDFAQKLMSRINAIQKEVKNINEAESLLSRVSEDPKAEVHIRKIVGPEWDDKIKLIKESSSNWSVIPKYQFKSMAAEGYAYVLGINNSISGELGFGLDLNPKNQSIILRAIEIEENAHINGNWVLYRGGTLTGDQEMLVKEEKPYSLSYGNSLFGGLIEETRDLGAMAFLYINDRGGYAISIPIVNYLMNGLSRRLFFIPPISTFLSLYLYGEHFHARSRVFVDKNKGYNDIAGFDGPTILPIEHITADSSFRTREEFESAFHSFFKVFRDNIFGIEH
jgi:hypothetical protein